MRPPPAGVKEVARAAFAERGACGRLVLASTAAGGIASGGILLGMLTLSGRTPPAVLVFLGPVFFVLGAAVGLTHAWGLVCAGHPEPTPLRQSLLQAAVATVVAVPALAGAWIVTAAIGATAALLSEPRVSFAAVSVFGWASGLAVCAWALFEIRPALGRALRRHPAAREAAGLALPLAVASSFWFLYRPPSIAGYRAPADWLWAVSLGTASTVWVALPLYVLARRLLGSLRSGRLESLP